MSMDSRKAAVRRRDALLARAWVVALSSCLLAPNGLAASVPWTPSLGARHAIEVLVDDGGLQLTVSQWPLPREAVQRALDALPNDLTPELAAARARVQAELRDQQRPRIGLTLRGREDALSGFGDDATPGSSLQLRSGELDGPHLVMQVGGRLDASADDGMHGLTARLDDTAVAVDAFGIQAQAWAHRSWWGVGWQSALPLSNNAPPLAGIGLQRAQVVPSESPWLSWLGPWNLDFFVARTVGQPDLPGGNAMLSGTRLTARPFSNVELGLTRMVQFGGRGRSETIDAFLRALSGVHSNVPDASDYYQDSGNGLAGYDIRVRCPGVLRCAGYGQFMGEDDRKHLPYRFLNLLGFETWGNDGVTRMYFEAAEVGCRITWRGSPISGCAYRNWFYPGGYTASNRWLGASAGSDARLLTIGWMDADWDSDLRLDLGRVGSHVGTYDSFSQEAFTSGNLVGLSARRTWHAGAIQLTPEFDWVHVDSAEGRRVSSRFGLEMSAPLDALDRAPAWFADRLGSASQPSTATRLLAAGALIGGAALFDRAADSYVTTHYKEPSLKVLRTGGAELPYVGFGLAGADWLWQRGTPDGDVALASVEAGLGSVAAAEVLKQAVDRSRPLDGRGASDFGHAKRSESSFPSAHAALAWGVITPIAQHYDAPWLYGVAALTNAARVASREHWLSDTVAGSVLGYVIGDWFGKRAGDGSAPGASVALLPRGVLVSASFR
jgi:membrane-associated phospholipid phosphatase